MELKSYLERIGFRGDPRPDLHTLRRLHRLHLESIPYENLDVQLGTRVGFDLDVIHRKLVISKRGGWCYEMNGLLAWALEQIGFRITRLAGAVVRDTVGDVSIGTHLALCVWLDRPYLADVGFGDGLVEPAAIEPGVFQQDDFVFRFERVDDAWWRFHNHPQGGAPSFDFQLIEAPIERLADRCEYLQSSPESPFVLNAVCQRYRDGQLSILRGRTLKVVQGKSVESRTIDSEEDFATTLQSVFGIEVPQISQLWRTVTARHESRLRAAASA